MVWGFHEVSAGAQFLLHWSVKHDVQYDECSIQTDFEHAFLMNGPQWTACLAKGYNNEKYK